MNMSATAQVRPDGVHAMVEPEDMDPAARKLREIYALKPGAPLVHREFGFYCLERWKEQGMPQEISHAELFHYDDFGRYGLWGLGWCEAGFLPAFECKLIEARGEHEVVQDAAGRHVLCFKGRRSGFMPTYLEHPVKDMESWERDVKWRLDPDTPGRLEELEKAIPGARAAAAKGHLISQHIVGGYMYLRSLIGPEDLLYKFYDEPELIHACMTTWLALADRVTALHQRHITFDELCFGEDICYNRGCLISPDMVRAFLFPYYQQLIANMKSRQLDRSRHLFVNVDTDGRAESVIPLYQEVGMDVMNPFEVASGCDVVEIGRRFPDLIMFGGIDKRILAQGKEAIDREVERILPAMRARGGYIPTCDHGVPEEVTYENYLHYRKRCVELGG